MTSAAPTQTTAAHSLQSATTSQPANLAYGDDAWIEGETGVDIVPGDGIAETMPPDSHTRTRPATSDALRWPPAGVLPARPGLCNWPAENNEQTTRPRQIGQTIFFIRAASQLGPSDETDSVRGEDAGAAQLVL